MIAAPGEQRLQRFLNLAESAERHLLAVRQRLFDHRSKVDGGRLRRVLEFPEGIDRLASFCAKFSRLQDTLVDKLLPALLERAGEHPGTAIDNLNRAERIGLVSNVDQWLAARRLRNRWVHEYMDDPEDTAAAPTEAYDFTDALNRAREAISAYFHGRIKGRGESSVITEHPPERLDPMRGYAGIFGD